MRALAGGRGRPADVGVPEADRRQRAAGNRRDRLNDARRSRTCCCRIFWSSRNRARRRERGDCTRAVAVRRRRGSVCSRALFYGAFWLTWQLDDYDELGDYLLRLGLSWLFLTFLSFLAFSGVVTALSTFFLSDDLRLLLAAPVAARRLFYARFARTVGAGVVDGGRLPRAGAARRRRGALRAARLLRDGGADDRAVRDHPGGGRHGVHAAAGQRLSRAPRARHPDAHGTALRGEHRHPAAHSSVRSS